MYVISVFFREQSSFESGYFLKAKIVPDYFHMQTTTSLKEKKKNSSLWQATELILSGQTGV